MTDGNQVTAGFAALEADAAESHARPVMETATLLVLAVNSASRLAPALSGLFRCLKVRRADLCRRVSRTSQAQGRERRLAIGSGA
jgi:hypothetical protein